MTQIITIKRALVNLHMARAELREAGSFKAVAAVARAISAVMTRRIPQVRKWRVRYDMPDNSRRDIFVATINKRFARWEARDRGGWGCLIDGATDETVSLVTIEEPTP